MKRKSLLVAAATAAWRCGAGQGNHSSDGSGYLRQTQVEPARNGMKLFYPVDLIRSAFSHS